MAVTINGGGEWAFQPLDYSTSILYDAFYIHRGNYLKSANDNIRYSFLWTNPATALNEATPALASNWDAATESGDVINVVFEVYAWTKDTNKELIATIKKSKDIANKSYNQDLPAMGHRFSIDISELMTNQLSYSLCPINKGTWQSNYYGGMNGGLVMQDNVIDGTGTGTGTPISNYNVSRNGSFRQVQVVATFEVLNADGAIIPATDTTSSNIITVINSVNQFEKNDIYYSYQGNDNGNYVISSANDSARVESQKFLSRCNNGTSSSSTIPFKAPIRIDEEAEFLQFFIFAANADDIGGAGDDTVGSIGLKIETFLANGSAENTFYVREFEDNAILNTGSTAWRNGQESNFIQNISPSFINGTNVSLKSTPTSGSFPYWNAYSGGKITALTSYYRVSMSKFGLNAFAERRSTEYRYYTIDREIQNIPYGFVRFHWLNSMGGIDSYTAKRNVVEGLSISRDVIERKSVDRTWYQNDTTTGTPIVTSLYHSDTMRGGDLYKGGREVSNVNAERNQSVYTEPLNIQMATWLEEIMTSPNVWIEMDTDATEMGNTMNSYLRPSTKGYIPVIITNNDIETVNQENGLVKFNIEYTLAHKVRTQRN
tara:strand:+ start:3696 stop:5498 length:1803 start_codon:yes stop_codon:yes gene_type:complete